MHPLAQQFKDHAKNVGLVHTSHTGRYEASYTDDGTRAALQFSMSDPDNRPTTCWVKQDDLFPVGKVDVWWMIDNVPMGSTIISLDDFLNVSKIKMKVLITAVSHTALQELDKDHQIQTLKSDSQNLKRGLKDLINQTTRPS